MPYFVPQKQKLSFILALLVCGIGMLGAFGAVIFFRQYQQAGGVWIKKSDLPEITFAIACFISLLYFGFMQVGLKVNVLISEAMDTLANGIIHFNKKGTMSYFNPAAALMLPDLVYEAEDSHFIGTYKKFLAYVYDHSLDIQDHSPLSYDIGRLQGPSRLLFREVVELPNHKIVIVQFYQKHSFEIVAVMTDISVMKRHLDEMAVLTEENMIMIKAIESAGGGLIIAQNHGVSIPIIFSNQIFAETMKVKQDEIIGKSLYDILEANFEDQIDRIRLAIREAKKDGAAHNIWLKMKNDKKEILWYSLTILFFVDVNGSEYFVSFLSDQTEEKLAQAQTYQAQKLEAIAQLAGGIAHDFNNVLSVVDGYAKLAQRGMDRGKDVSDFFEQIHRSVKRGSEITGRLLTFGQCRVTQKIRFDICERVRDLEAFLSPMMPHSINMILSVQSEPCYIDASPDAITQIVLNLASNARDAMKDGGDLIVSVAEASRSQLLSVSQPVDPRARYVCIQIIDSGSGIEPDILSRIYEPFFTSKDVAKNPGLGLSLVYGLVKEMDGIIDVKSTLGVGTSVSVIVPLQEASRAALQPRESIRKIDTSELQGKTILVVEDSPEVLEMQCRFLEDVGLRVLRAASGLEAMQIQEAIKDPIDFLLSDVTMPDMSGVKLGELFAAQRPDTRIILISAYPALALIENEAAGERGLPEGRIILAKPLVYEHLTEVLISQSRTDGAAAPGGYYNWQKREKIT